MNALSIGTSSIRELDGLYSLNDLHKASGGAANQKPSEWLRNKQAQELVSEIIKAGIPALLKKHGGCSGSQTYACRELVIAYAAWISAAFHLRVLRVFLDFGAVQFLDTTGLTAPLKASYACRTLHGGDCAIMRPGASNTPPSGIPHPSDTRFFYVYSFSTVMVE